MQIILMAEKKLTKAEEYGEGGDENDRRFTRNNVGPPAEAVGEASLYLVLTGLWHGGQIL